MKKYGVKFYTKSGEFDLSEYRDNLYEILQLYMQDNEKCRPTIWVLDGEEYVRVHDFMFSRLSAETYIKYLAERIIETDYLLAQAEKDNTTRKAVLHS